MNCLEQGLDVKAATENNGSVTPGDRKSGIGENGAATEGNAMDEFATDAVYHIPGLDSPDETRDCSIIF